MLGEEENAEKRCQAEKPDAMTQKPKERSGGLDIWTEGLKFKRVRGELMRVAKTVARFGHNAKKSRPGRCGPN